METLKLYRGDTLLAQVALADRPLELGCGAGCDLIVDDPAVACRHWLVMRQLGGVVAYDVSQGPSSRAQPLPLGHPVAFGRHHSLVRGEERRGGALARDTESLALVRDAETTLFLVVGRGAEARRVRVRDKPVHVGRAPDNELVVSDRAASARHCRFEPSPDGVVVRDLGSSNGTFVNGVRVERALCGSGAQVRVGRTDLQLLERDVRGRIAGTGMVAESASMLAVLAEARRAAELSWPALILGESGSGKEGVAGLLHAHGPRSKKPFVTLNAGGVPRELIESELFGHERGAFTGASNARRGVFEQAEGGTLFLDEIGELPLSLQARLLRVLESGEVRRVGSESSRSIDVRVVCATHRDLRAMVADGAFRQDLYFRIARVVLEIPPLRLRLEDVDALSRHVLRELSGAIGHKQLSPAAQARLRAHRWPGNVRELRNVLSAAALGSASPRIERHDLERALDRVGGGVAVRATTEPEALREALAHFGGNVTAAARALGVPRTTLRDRTRHMR
jgi:transcriptional regulator with AAA-type ATPase domain